MADCKRKTVNLFDESTSPVTIYPSTPTISSSSNAISVIIPVDPNTTYTFSKSLGNRNRFCETESAPTQGATSLNYINADDNNIQTITTGSTTHYILWWVGYQQTYSEIAETMMVNTGSTAFPYEPYYVHSLRKLTTATDSITTLPAVIYADGSPLTSYTIHGNMTQGGTPTPENPITPSECGERTKNLFDKDNAPVIHIFPTASGVVSERNDVYSIILPCKPNTTYTYSKRILPHRMHRVAGYAEYPALEMESVFLDETSETIEGDEYAQNIFTTTADARWLLIIVAAQAAYDDYFNLIQELQVEESNGRTSYEPYGYKLPVETAEDILVNNLTTQEYNGLTLTRNADGSVRVQGTATANSNFHLHNNSHSAYLASYQILENGIYYIGGGIEGGEENKFILSAAYDDALGGTAARRFRIPYGENIRIDNSNGEYKYLSVYIAVWNGATVDFTCKPYLKAESTTNDIYLGEVQTTRYIKKLVLDGTESWNIYTTNNKFFYVNHLVDNVRQINGFCSHFRYFVVTSSNTANGVCVTANGAVRLRYSEYNTVDDFKSYLAAQYSVGTPVTVWYVLTETETGVLNEPIRKIGDYTDTVSMSQAGVSIPTNNGSTMIDVDTTLKPSGMELGYTGWHDATVKEFNGTAWE